MIHAGSFLVLQKGRWTMTTKMLPRTFLTGLMFLAPLAPAALGQQYAPAPGMLPAPPVMAAPSQAAPQYTEDQVEQLLAPIALYPDPLLAQVLPASTYPLEIASAAQWLATNPNPGDASLAGLPWEPSVVALIHYPPVLQYLSANLDWTQALGAAFLNQQADVLNAIQVLRARAMAAGVLASTPQQQVAETGNDIYIEPVDPQVIYVPEYDPQWLYAGWVGGPGFGGLRFGLGFHIGAWLDNDFDWGHHWIAAGAGWNHGWREGDRGPRIEHPLVTRPWAHNPAKPGPVLLREPAREPVRDERRGYAVPAAGHPELRVPEVRLPEHAARPVPVVRPEPVREQHPAAVAPARVQPASEVFNSGQSRAQVERAAQRGNESRAAAQPHPQPAAPPPARPSYSPPSGGGSGGSGGPGGPGGGGSSAFSGGGGQAASARGNQSMRH
jgi:hypothetical protein